MVGSLTHEQARHYRTEGYFRLPRVFSQREVAALRTFIQLEAAKEPDGTSVKLYGLYDRRPSLMQHVVTHPVLIGALQSILGPNIVFIKNRHNHATLNQHVGEPSEGLHRDILQPTRGLVTAAVYLDDATADNGATRLIPGSHDLPYVGVPQAGGGGTWLADHHEFDGFEDQALSIAMPAGGVLLFNGLAFHGVGANTTGQPRMSMTLGFRSVDELDVGPDMTRQLIVAGEMIYRGNDQRPQ